MKPSTHVYHSNRNARSGSTKSHRHSYSLGNCYIHHSHGSITQCSVCGKPLCRNCATQTPFPHICSFCHPRYYKSKTEVYKQRRFNYVGLVLTLTMIVFIMTVSIASAVDVYHDLGVKEQDTIPGPTPLIYFDSAQIFPKLDEKTYISSEGKVGINFRLYVTNLYQVVMNPVKVDIMILKNDTIRDETDSDPRILDPNSTEMFEFEYLYIYPGTYQAHFVLWQNNKVVDKETVNFMVNKDDIQEVNPPKPTPTSIPVPSDDVVDDDIPGDDDDDNDANWVFPTTDDEKKDSGFGGDDDSVGMFAGGACLVGFVVLLVIVIVSIIIVVTVAARKGRATAQRKEALEELKEANTQRQQ